VAEIMTQRITKEFGAVIANNWFSDNGVKIELSESINGSSDQAFGGAKSWPHLTVDVGFQVGQYDVATRIAILIEEILRREDIITEE
jgi:hypothetical protein